MVNMLSSSTIVRLVVSRMCPPSNSVCMRFASSSLASASTFIASVLTFVLCFLSAASIGFLVDVPGSQAQPDTTPPAPARDLRKARAEVRYQRGFFIPAYLEIDEAATELLNQKFDLVILNRYTDYSGLDTSKTIAISGLSVLCSSSLGDPDEWNLINANEDWFLHSSPTMSPQTRISLPGIYSHLFYMNVGSEGWKNFVVSKYAETIARNPVAKAVFVDGPPDPAEYAAQVGTAYPDYDAITYQTVTLEFIRQIKDTVGEKLVILNTELSKLFTLAGDGGMVEGFVHFGGRRNDEQLGRVQWLRDIELIGDRDFDGKYVLIGSGSLEPTLPSMVEYCYASFLIGYNPYAHCYFYWHSNAEGGYASINWFTLWELEIGEPLGGYFETDGVFRRDFSEGVVLVNPNDVGEPITIRLNGTYLDSSGNVVTGATLPNKSGVVLKKQTWSQ